LTATRTKRILSVQPVAERGGSDYCLLRMVRSLAEDGWECHIALPEASPMAEEFAAAGATLHVVAMRRITTSGSPLRWLEYVSLWPLSVLRLTLLARRVHADVIHTNSLHSWYGWAVAAALGRPHVWHAREIVVQSAAALRLERWLCRHFADKVIAVSIPVAAQLGGSDVVVIHDIANTEEFSPRRAGRFRGNIGIADDVALVGAAGRIDTWKGFDVVLDAVGAMQSARPGLELVIAGGAVKGKEAYAAHLGARAAGMPGVHWLGPRLDMPELLADLDVFVLASTQPEPFATVLIEALASGVPVVATDHGGSPEILAEVATDAGLLVPPGDSSGLAAAAVRMLPPVASSTGRRRERQAQQVRQGTGFAEFFDSVMAKGRLSCVPRRRRRTTGAIPQRSVSS
jgi:glycosyltransferase involved in cell wall biosynthesis